MRVTSRPGIPGVPNPANEPTPPGRPVRDEPWWVRDLRRVAAVTTAGATVGLVVVGLGTRLAMFVLAMLNPQLHGRVSDDGFVMGQFDLGATALLIGFGIVVGVTGGLLLLALRPLRFGPEWFHTTAMVVGPAVVAAAVLVHTGGVDFTVPEPRWLPIALFTGLPLLASYALVGIGEAWLDRSSWFRKGSRWRTLPALGVVVVGPLLVLVVVVAGLRALHQTSDTGEAVLGHSAVAWTGRVLAAAVVAVALVDLLRDVATLL